jgi:hypothetical protein
LFLISGIDNTAVSDLVHRIILRHGRRVDNLGDTLLTAALAQLHTRSTQMSEDMTTDRLGDRGTDSETATGVGHDLIRDEDGAIELFRELLQPNFRKFLRFLKKNLRFSSSKSKILHRF